MKNFRRKLKENILVRFIAGVLVFPFMFIWLVVDWAVCKRWTKHPTLYSVESIMEMGNPTSDQPKTALCVDGKWVPARSEGYASLRHRIKIAWEVFTGKADAIRWPGDQ